MRLLVDAGNTLVKWQLRSTEGVLAKGSGALDHECLFQGAVESGGSVNRVVVSTVASEADRARLVEKLAGFTRAPVSFYWAEPARKGLICAYAEPARMGADRWHALYGAWCGSRDAFAVVDAGSAVTIDFVATGGRHIGGYILPGKDMMFRSLRNDAARIGFGDLHAVPSTPGTSTDQCVFHGRNWLWQGLIDQLARDCEQLSIQRLLVTGGDAPELVALGMRGEHRPDLVLEGLSAIDLEESG